MKNKKINIYFSNYTFGFALICVVLISIACKNLIKIHKYNNIVFEPHYTGVYAIYKNYNDDDDSIEEYDLLHNRFTGYSPTSYIHFMKDDYYVIDVNEVSIDAPNLDNILEHYVQDTSFFALDEANYEKWSQGDEYEYIYAIDDIHDVDMEDDDSIKLTVSGKGFRKSVEYSSNNKNKKIYMIMNGDVICEKTITKPTDMFIIDGIHYIGDYNRIFKLLLYKEGDPDLSLAGYYIKATY